MPDIKNEIKYEIVEQIAVLSESSSGWKRELNLVSWNGREPKYDLRDWDQNHARMGKGITFTKDEMESLRDVLNKIEE